jgi:intracellular sulfur oxidation DsrE/DsrF family protein
MRSGMFKFLFAAAFCFFMAASHAEKVYSPAKAVYDVSTADATEFGHILDRISLLERLYDNNSFEASIIMVIHEGAIPLFVKTNQPHAELMQRAEGLTLGDTIKFRICAASAKMQGFSNKDFPTFTTLVPMADAEIIQLQNQGYAYLR